MILLSENGPIPFDGLVNATFQEPTAGNAGQCCEIDVDEWRTINITE